MTDTPEGQSPSYQAIERMGSVPRFPEVTQEDLRLLSLQDTHEVVNDVLVGYLAEHKGSEELLEKIKYPLFGFWLLKPEFTLGQKSDTSEDLPEFIKAIKILRQAALRCARPDVNPVYQAAVYDNFMLMQNFIDAHGNQTQARAMKGLYHGLKGEIALEKTFNLSGKFRLFSPDSERNPAAAFATDVVGDIDDLAQYLVNRNVVLTVHVEATDEIAKGYHISGPRRTLIADRVIERVDLGTRSRIQNAQRKNTLFRVDILFAAGDLPDLDPNLGPREAFEQLALPPEETIHDIIRKTERRLPKIRG